MQDASLNVSVVGGAGSVRWCCLKSLRYWCLSLCLVLPSIFGSSSSTECWRSLGVESRAWACAPLIDLNSLCPTTYSILIFIKECLYSPVAIIRLIQSGKVLSAYSLIVAWLSGDIGGAWSPRLSRELLIFLCGDVRVVPKHMTVWT